MRRYPASARCGWKKMLFSKSVLVLAGPAHEPSRWKISPGMSSRTAQPRPRPCAANSLRSPLFADAPAGMTSFWMGFYLEALWCPFWSPNRYRNCFCDLWVVKCAALLRRDAIRFRRKRTLDDPDVALMLDDLFWWNIGCTKIGLDENTPLIDRSDAQARSPLPLGSTCRSTGRGEGLRSQIYQVGSRSVWAQGNWLLRPISPHPFPLSRWERGSA
jgi:hypothetical protein